jgi:hypothetical protein
MSEPVYDVAALFNQSIRVAGEGEGLPPGCIEATADLLGDGELVRLFIPAHLIPSIPVEGSYSLRGEGGADVVDVAAGS